MVRMIWAYCRQRALLIFTGGPERLGPQALRMTVLKAVA